MSGDQADHDRKFATPGEAIDGSLAESNRADEALRKAIKDAVLGLASADAALTPPLKGLNFGQALALMKNDIATRRKGWSPAKENVCLDNVLLIQINGEIDAYAPTSADMLAEDWESVP